MFLILKGGKFKFLPLISTKTLETDPHNIRPELTLAFYPNEIKYGATKHPFIIFPYQSFNFLGFGNFDPKVLSRLPLDRSALSRPPHGYYPWKVSFLPSGSYPGMKYVWQDQLVTTITESVRGTRVLLLKQTEERDEGTLSSCSLDPEYNEGEVQLSVINFCLLQGETIFYYF